MASPYQITGSLPFGGGGGNIDFSGSAAGLASNYKGAYDSALAMNQTNYNNIMGGYNQLLADQQAQQGRVSAGYTSLYNNVLNTIQGTQQANATAIADEYARQGGMQAQGLINRGLGNTTVQNSVQRGIVNDRDKALTNNQNQFAQLQANYMSQLGLSGLAYDAQAQQQNSRMAEQQLQFMNSVSAAYPAAGLYAQLAQQGAANEQSQRDRDLLAQRTNQGIPTGQIGYIPSGGGFSAPASFGGGYGVGGGGYAGSGWNSALAQPVAADAWSGYLAQPEASGPGFFEGVTNDVAGGLYGQALGGYDAGGYEDMGGGIMMDDNGDWYGGY